MSLLDELEQQAQREREEQSRAAAGREDRERYWTQQLLPAMQSLDAYLQRLTQNLAFLKRRIRASYPVPGYGEIVADIEPAFSLESTPAKSSYDIVLEGVAVVATEACPVVECENQSRVRSVSAVLQQHKLGGMTETRRSPDGGDPLAARFQARGRIPLLLQVHADIDSGQARMSFQNFEGFNQSTRCFSAEQLDAELFDALGRFIMREQAGFAQETLDEDVRRRLQARLRRDRQKRQLEQKLQRQFGGDQQELMDTLDPALRPNGFMSRLKAFSQRLAGR
jgi:hypothetical protein